MQWTLEEDVLFYCDNGFRAIGLSLNKVESFGREKSKELIHDLGMEVSSLGSIGFHNDIAGTTLDDQIDEAKDAVVVAAELAASEGHRCPQHCHCQSLPCPTSRTETLPPPAAASPRRRRLRRLVFPGYFRQRDDSSAKRR